MRVLCIFNETFLVIFFLRKSFWDKTQDNIFERTISPACGYHQLTWGEIGGPRDAFCEVYLGASRAM